MDNATGKMLSAVGLCKKAGKLIIGFDAVAAAISRGEVCLMALSADLSPKSAKEIIRLAERRGVKYIKTELNMQDIGRILGKKAGILAVTDQGLAKAVELKHSHPPS